MHHAKLPTRACVFKRVCLVCKGLDALQQDSYTPQSLVTHMYDGHVSGCITLHTRKLIQMCAEMLLYCIKTRTHCTNSSKDVAHHTNTYQDVRGFRKLSEIH